MRSTTVVEWIYERHRALFIRRALVSCGASQSGAKREETANRSQKLSSPKLAGLPCRQTLKGSECRTRFRKHDRTDSAKRPRPNHVRRIHR